METRRLEYFVRIAEAGSISRAAILLGMSQPALSQQLLILEKELRTRLVERSALGIALTPSGEALFGHAQLIIRKVEDLKFGLDRGIDPFAGIVSVGFARAQSVTLGVPLVEGTLARHPQMQLQTREDASAPLVKQLHVGSLDMIVAPIRGAHPELVIEPLYSEELLLISAADAGPPPQELGKLAQMPWIVGRGAHALRGLLGSMFIPAEEELHIMAEMASMRLLLRTVEKGLGVALLPASAVTRELAEGSLRAWPMPQPAPKWTVCICTRREGYQKTAVAAVGAMLREIADSLVPDRREHLTLAY